MSYLFNPLLSRRTKFFVPAEYPVNGIEDGNLYLKQELEIGKGIHGEIISVVEISELVYDIEFSIVNELINQTNIIQSIQNGTFLRLSINDSFINLKVIGMINESEPYKVKAVVAGLHGDLNNFESSATVLISLIYKKIN